MKGFQRILFLCIVGTYLVILAGAVVRGTGSGLGCPDWPRCFGQWIPPTDISELPANYKELYKISGKTIADFEAFKTWTEYVNRLLGVVLGFLMIGLFIRSFKVRNIDRSIPWFTGGLLFLIIIQGGVGALVVSTHLKPFVITIHMFLAVMLLFGLLYLRKYCRDLADSSLVPPTPVKSLFISRVLVWITFFQVMLGTQVRQQVDHLMRDTLEATQYTVIGQLNFLFFIHRSFSLILVGGLIYLLVIIQRDRSNRGDLGLAVFSFLACMANVVSGISLNYFDFPPIAQPPHLFFGVLTLGLLYQLSLNLRGSLLDD